VSAWISSPVRLLARAQSSGISAYKRSARAGAQLRAVRVHAGQTSLLAERSCAPNGLSRSSSATRAPKRSRPLSSRRAPRREDASSAKNSYHGRRWGSVGNRAKHRQHFHPLVPECVEVPSAISRLSAALAGDRVAALVRPIRRGAWWLRPMDACLPRAAGSAVNRCAAYRRRDSDGRGAQISCEHEGSNPTSSASPAPAVSSP